MGVEMGWNGVFEYVAVVGGAWKVGDGPGVFSWKLPITGEGGGKEKL